MAKPISNYETFLKEQMDSTVPAAQQAQQVQGQEQPQVPPLDDALKSEYDRLKQMKQAILDLENQVNAKKNEYQVAAQEFESKVAANQTATAQSAARTV